MEMPLLSEAALAARLKWYLIKLPLTLSLITVGFLLETLFSWPFALLCRLHVRHGAR